MKYITIFLVLAMISCKYSGETEYDKNIDTFKVDSVDSRTEVIDTVKKKFAPNQYTIKCVAYRIWRIS